MDGESVFSVPRRDKVFGVSHPLHLAPSAPQNFARNQTGPVGVCPYFPRFWCVFFHVVFAHGMLSFFLQLRKHDWFIQLLFTGDYKLNNSILSVRTMKSQINLFPLNFYFNKESILWKTVDFSLNRLLIGNIQVLLCLANTGIQFESQPTTCGNAYQGVWIFPGHFRWKSGQALTVLITENISDGRRP